MHLNRSGSGLFVSVALLTAWPWHCSPPPATNSAPTGISLSNTTVGESEPASTTVATLAAVDPDVGDTHQFALVAGDGGRDNASFAIDGTTLETVVALNVEAGSFLSIRIGVTDNHGAPFEEQFTISVTTPCASTSAVPIDVGDVAQQVVDAHPPGTSYLIKAGVHLSNFSVQPKSGDTFCGEPGAVLDGGRSLKSEAPWI